MSMRFQGGAAYASASREHAAHSDGFGYVEYVHVFQARRGRGASMDALPGE